MPTPTPAFVQHPDGAATWSFPDTESRNRWLAEQGTLRVIDDSIPGTYYTADGMLGVSQLRVTVVPLAALDAETRLRRARALAADAFWAQYRAWATAGATEAEAGTDASEARRLEEVTVTALRTAYPGADAVTLDDDATRGFRQAITQLVAIRAATPEDIPLPVLEQIEHELWEVATSFAMRAGMFPDGA